MNDRGTTDQGERVRRAIEEYEGQLLRYAGRLMRDLELARDVVQETLLTLCREPGAASQDRLREWLYVVCRHRALEVMRKEKRMQTLNEQQAAGGGAHSGAPDQAAARSEESGRAARIIGSLPERQQEVVRLKFQSGLSYREIARVMDLSVSNVGVILHTAMKTIRRAMSDESGKAAEAGRA
jgi:RNA polymerase sigma-70 factor (ECF subfamily)